MHAEILGPVHIIISLSIVSIAFDTAEMRRMNVVLDQVIKPIKGVGGRTKPK